MRMQTQLHLSRVEGCSSRAYVLSARVSWHGASNELGAHPRTNFDINDAWVEPVGRDRERKIRWQRFIDSRVALWSSWKGKGDLAKVTWRCPEEMNVADAVGTESQPVRTRRIIKKKVNSVELGKKNYGKGVFILAENFWETFAVRKLLANDTKINKGKAFFTMARYKFT